MGQRHFKTRDLQYGNFELQKIISHYFSNIVVIVQEKQTKFCSLKKNSARESCQ